MSLDYHLRAVPSRDRTRVAVSLGCVELTDYERVPVGIDDLELTGPHVERMLDRADLYTSRRQLGVKLMNVR